MDYSPFFPTQINTKIQTANIDHRLNHTTYPNYLQFSPDYCSYVATDHELEVSYETESLVHLRSIVKTRSKVADNAIRIFQ